MSLSLRLLEALVSCLTSELKLNYLALVVLSSFESVKKTLGKRCTKFGSYHLVFSSNSDPVSSNAHFLGFMIPSNKTISIFQLSLFFSARIIGQKWLICHLWKWTSSYVLFLNCFHLFFLL